MAADKDLYQVLGVAPSADAETLKSAYRQLVRKYHPDVNPNNPIAEERFKDLNEAYSILSDPEKRKAYNQSRGHRAAPPPPSSASSGRDQTKKPPPDPARKPSSAPKTAPQKQRSKASVDIHNTGFKEVFDTLFGKEPASPQAKGRETSRPKRPPPTPPQAAPPLRGEDLTMETFLSPEESQEGTVKTVQVDHKAPCGRCSQTGKVHGMPCTVCRGEKFLVTVKKIDVRIPPGVRPGSKVRITKEGLRGQHGGEPGDLYLLVRVQHDPALRMDGESVACTVSISVPEAVLGSEITVPTLRGRMAMTIPPLTPHGKVFRLKGQGLQSGTQAGDQYVTVQIALPLTLSQREQALYEELLAIQKSHTAQDT